MKRNDFLNMELQDCLGIITMNNPPQNFIPTPDFIDEDALLSFLRVPEIKGVVITGSGRHFSAGADLENLKSLSGFPIELAKSISYGKNLLNIIENINLPVVAAIKGICFGGGFEIALSAHIRVSSENALFAFPEINHQLMPGLAGTITLPILSGVSDALQLLLSGNTIDAQKAKAMRLINYIVPQKEVMNFSVQMLTQLVKDRPRYVIEAIVQSIMNSGKLPLEQALEKETQLFCKLAVNANF
ncbi:MAG: enoyl-CoA hydratase/isomerase family protein [Bacteroidota bacterium]